MDPTSRIRKLGFQRWYERQLIEAHAALVACFVSGIGIAAMFEGFSLRNFDADMLARVGLMFGAFLLGLYSWRHYITVLERAELYGERSTCPDCHTYARFDILATGMDDVPGRTATAVAPLGAAWLRVQCRKCRATWRMPE
jgi:hypothetical protein